MSSSEPEPQAKRRRTTKTFDRDEVAAELLSLYEFLVQMYLPEDAIRRAPPRGWPNITKERLDFLGKDDVVVDLLRHLPYVKDDGTHAGSQHRGYDIYDECKAIDYGDGEFQTNRTDSFGNVLRSVVDRKDKGEIEGEEVVSSHVATLAQPSAKYGWWIWLDTRDGTVEMLLCVYGGTNHFEGIATFCDYVKTRFRSLEIVPHSQRTVKEGRPVRGNPCRAVEIFTRHGWPSFTYDKAACMAEIEEDDDVVGD